MAKKFVPQPTLKFVPASLCRRRSIFCWLIHWHSPILQKVPLKAQPTKYTDQPLMIGKLAGWRATPLATIDQRRPAGVSGHIGCWALIHFTAAINSCYALRRSPVVDRRLTTRSANVSHNRDAIKYRPRSGRCGLRFLDAAVDTEVAVRTFTADRETIARQYLIRERIFLRLHFRVVERAADMSATTAVRAVFRLAKFAQ